MKINPITIASAAYALYAKSKEGNELKEQKALISEMEPYYVACENNKAYDAAAAAIDAATRAIKDGLNISYMIRMGHPGVTTYFSFDADVVVTNNSSYNMDVIGVLMVPIFNGIQFGDIPGYTLLDYVDVERLSGRLIPAGGSETIGIRFKYLKMNKADRKTLRKLIKQKLGLKTLYDKGSCPIRSSIEMVVKKDRTAFADARYLSYGIGETRGTFEWMGENYHVFNELKDQENTIQDNKSPNKYGYLSLMSLFSDNPTFKYINQDQPTIE